jgi:hypothetical protein
MADGGPGVMRRWQPWLVALALALPLVGLAGWIVRSAVAGGTASPAVEPSGPADDGLPAPTDYTAERFEERVDGAAPALRAAGCERLRHWRLGAPPADAEALFFRSVDAARAALAREAGPGRTPGPGEEAQASAQSIYFRRGAVVVRLFADPEAASEADAPALLLRARQLDEALRGRPGSAGG